MNKITTINGILMTAQDDFTGHAENETVHVTEEERARWNEKADASELASKVDESVFNSHQADAAVHVTEEERQRWNAAPELDPSGNMNLSGSLTATGAITANGGINVPLDSLNTLTNTTALNAYWAAGMMAVSDVWQFDLPVNKSGNTAYGDAELTDWPAGGSGLAVKVPIKGYGSADVAFSSYLTGGSWSNYGCYGGFYLPLGFLLLNSPASGIRGKVKFTWTTYGENSNRFDYKHDATDFDLFSLMPKSGQDAPVIDVTIETVASGNAPVRVRMLKYDSTSKSYRLITVQAQVPGLTGYGSACRGLVWCQSGDKGGVWLIVGNGICKIAEVPAVGVYETSGLNWMHVDMFSGDLPWVDSARICFSRVRNLNSLIFGGLPCYSVIESMGTDCQVSTSTEPWTPPQVNFN